MGSIPVAGAKKAIAQKCAMAFLVLATSSNHLQNALHFGLGSHFQLRPMGARSQKVRRK